MKLLILSLMIVFAVSVTVDPYAEMSKIKNCVPVINKAGDKCNTIEPKQDHYFERYYACYQKAAVALTFQCSQFFCESERLDNTGVDCTKKYTFSDTIYGYAPKNDAMTKACKVAAGPAVDLCNSQFKNYTIPDYYQKYYDCISTQKSIEKVPGCAKAYCLDSGLAKYVKCDSEQEMLVAFKKAEFEIFEFPTFNFTNEIQPDCFSLLNATAPICNKLPTNIVNYYQYFYQCYQQNVKNAQCTQSFCFEYNLDKEGVNCSKTYHLPKTQPIPQPKPIATCVTQQIKGCASAISEAVNYCNKTVKSIDGRYYKDFYSCIQEYKQVKAVNGCAICYCQQIRLFDISPGLCPAPKDSMISNVVANKDIFKFPNFNFTNEINPNCEVLINQTSYNCDKINPNTVNYYEYYYQCYQNSLQNQPCAESFCYEYRLDKVGVNCSKNYSSLPKPVVPAQKKNKQPKCNTQTNPRCYKAVTLAVQLCNKSVKNQANFYDKYYECIETLPQVKAVTGCAQCYCEQTELNLLTKKCNA